MEAEARAMRNEYMRNWRSKNKDKVKATQEKYWENKTKNNSKGSTLINNDKEFHELNNISFELLKMDNNQNYSLSRGMQMIVDFNRLIKKLSMKYDDPIIQEAAKKIKKLNIPDSIYNKIYLKRNDYMLNLNKLINSGLEIKLGDKQVTIKLPTIDILQKTDKLIQKMTNDNAYENRFEITKILLNNNVEGVKFTDEEIKSIPVKLQTQIHEEINNYVFDVVNNLE